LNWTKALFSISIEPLYTCRTAHVSLHWLQIQRCYIFLEQIRFFFLSGPIKFIGSGLKFRVGRVSGNTTFFFVWPHYYLVSQLGEGQVSCQNLLPIVFEFINVKKTKQKQNTNIGKQTHKPDLTIENSTCKVSLYKLWFSKGVPHLKCMILNNLFWQNDLTKGTVVKI
jgi:hypothetical protein